MPNKRPIKKPSAPTVQAKQGRDGKRKPSTKRSRKPSARRELFVEKVVANGGNVSRAAREAGYSAATARTRAYEWAIDPETQALIEERKQAAIQAARTSNDEVIGNLVLAMRCNSVGTTEHVRSCLGLAKLLGIEQQPRKNDGDWAREVEKYERLVEVVILRAKAERGIELKRADAIAEIAIEDKLITQYVC